MNIISIQQELEQKIKEHPIVLLYFTGNACGACEVIKGRNLDLLAFEGKIHRYIERLE